MNKKKWKKKFGKTFINTSRFNITKNIQLQT